MLRAALTASLIVLLLNTAYAGWGTVAICPDGCGFWSACANYSTAEAAERVIKRHFEKNGHKCRFLETTDKKFIVVVFAEGKKGIGWEAGNDQNDALDKAMGHYRRRFGSLPHLIHIYNNEKGGEVVQGVIN